ncbi:MAG: PEP-CTERM sorting domain-containing protein [Verrucomicrobiales bacterium]|nr:PEP-CTERM sorting domain-containing protein [Verrucomicrobiales bacterium]MCP5527736.1 PEP-CTERM sorting domain-containing protein [Verrucomicrobiales bacterium]
MKKLIVLAACVGATAMAFGQGQFNLNNRVTGSVDARVTNGAGDPLNGADGWVAQAYMSDAENGSYSPIADSMVTFRSSPVPAGLGYLNGGIKTVAGSDAGSSIWVKLYAWNTNDGASYEAAEAAFGSIGMSNGVQISLGGGTIITPDLVGLQGFSVAAVPEPSTLALGLLGIGALMLRRRR